MPQSNIHPASIIEDGAVIGENVTIEPYAVIKKDAIIGDNAVVKSHVCIEGHTTIGDGSVIYPGAVIGCAPQAIKYRGEKSTINIGKNCQIREYVTINSSLGEGSVVNIGDNSMIMAYSHLAHNCTIGRDVIISNNAAISGHVVIEDYAIIGGKIAIHQFVRIGKYAMVGGFSPLGRDVPPFTIGTICVVGHMILFSIQWGTSYYVEILLIFALLGFTTALVFMDTLFRTKKGG